MACNKSKVGWADPAFTQEIRERVEQVVRKLDPIGLLEIGCPPDDYDGEIDHIVWRLVRYKSAPPVDELQSVLHDTFVKAFDDKLAGPASLYREAAAQIANLWAGD